MTPAVIFAFQTPDSLTRLILNGYASVSGVHVSKTPSAVCATSMPVAPTTRPLVSHASQSCSLEPAANPSGFPNPIGQAVNGLAYRLARTIVFRLYGPHRSV